VVVGVAGVWGWRVLYGCGVGGGWRGRGSFFGHGRAEVVGDFAGPRWGWGVVGGLGNGWWGGVGGWRGGGGVVRWGRWG